MSASTEPWENIPSEPEVSDQQDVSGDIAPPDPVPESEPDSHIRLIPGAAGHGPARAYGYMAIAAALGVPAGLTEGGTRSTGAHPLQVTVQADESTFARINEIYDEVAPVAEQVAAAKRDEARKSGRELRSYEVSLLTRAVVAGFPQGVASALREPGTTRPAPFRGVTRARITDEAAHRSAVAMGRAWAVKNLQAAQRERELHHSAA